MYIHIFILVKILIFVYYKFSVGIQRCSSGNPLDENPRDILGPSVDANAENFEQKIEKLKATNIKILIKQIFTSRKT